MAKNTNRIRVAGPVIKSREQAEEVMGQIRDFTIVRNAHEVEREAAKKDIDDKFGPQIAELTEEIAAKTEQLMVWAEANEDVFGKNRSLQMVHGELGWRKSPPEVVKKVRTAWNKMVDVVKSKLGLDYIRNKPEVDREKIKAAYKAGVLTADQLATADLAVEQKDGFFVEPRIEESDARVTSEKRRAA